MLESQLDGHVLRLTLNRPEKRNALSLDLCRSIVSALDLANEDQQVHAVLLAANGASFCAGMDLSEMGVVDGDALSQIHDALFSVGQRMTTPIVAAVQGAALGGGVGVVSNAHIVVAAPDATFGLTEIRIGLWPFLIFRSIAAAIGERRAIEWSITGRIVNAQEAMECGLIHHVAQNPLERAEEIARSIANPFAIRSGLEYVRESRGKDWKEGGEVARRVRSQVLEGQEFAAGLKDFRERKRVKTT